MRRSQFLAGLIATLAASSAGGQVSTRSRVYRIGYLSTPTRASVQQPLDAFLRKLVELGWRDGDNLVIEYRWADGDVEQLPTLAADLVRSNVDLIVAPAGSAALAAKTATSTIPIVTMFSGDPVALGLVISLGSPGGNVTGTALTTGEGFASKQIELLREVVPHLTKLAVLQNSADSSLSPQLRELKAVARNLKTEVHFVDAKSPVEFEPAFASMRQSGSEALVVAVSSTYMPFRAQLAELAIQTKLPAIFSYREFAEAGGLMSYAVNMSEFIGRSAIYVDRILKGAKPASLPVEQPTKFELIVNLKTANTLGLAIPFSLLARADSVIE